VRLLVNAHHGWVFWPVLVVAVAAAVWSYRRVPRTVGPRLRATLAALRATALALLVLALIEPVLAFTRTLSEPPVVAVLVDASRSMGIADGPGGAARSEEALAALNGIVLPRLAHDAVVRAYAFSGTVEELDVSGTSVRAAPAPDGGVTDMGGALSAVRDELAGENLAAVVLASDGANNRGVSPADAAAALGVPVFTLGVGSREPKADIAIRDAVTNRISYVGEPLPVEVRLSAHGFGDASTVVSVSEDGVTLDARPVEVRGTGEESVVTLRVTPGAPGVHRYDVSVPAAPGELTTANNARVVVTTTLTGKIKALVAGARPSWDYAFLRRELEADRNVEVTAVARTGRAASDATLPRTREELLAYDLVALVEPDWSSPVVPAEWLAAFVRERGGGLLVIGLPRSSATPSPELVSVLPVEGRPGGAAPAELRAALTEAGEASPTMRVVADRFANASTWRSLPPVWADARPASSVRGDATVLAEVVAPDGGRAPLVAVRRVGAGHAMLVAAEAVWRWKMAGPADTDAYGRLVAGAVRWLTARGDIAPLSVFTERDVVAAGEPISFTAQVVTNELRPTTDAAVTLTLASGPEAAPIASVALAPEGDTYRGEAGPLPAGEYVYEAVAVRGGEEVGRARGELTVEPFSLEDAETRLRPAVLMELARATGGVYVSSETVASFPDDVRLEGRRATRTLEFEVWNSPWLLVGFLGCLSAEWAARRMKGLA